MEEFCEQCNKKLSAEYFSTECCGDVCYSCFEGLNGGHAHYVCEGCHNGVEYYVSCSQGCDYDGVQ